MMRYYKGSPSEYVIHYVRGRVQREGRGLSFFYLPSTATIVSMPVVAGDVDFSFKENTADFQPIVIEGQAHYRIVEPSRLAGTLDFSVDPATKEYLGDGPKKLDSRMVNAIREAMQQEIQRLPLETILRRRAGLAKSTLMRARQSHELISLGIELQNLYVTSIEPTPDTAKALEADRKETILMKADKASFQRKMIAMEHQRKMLRADDAPASTIECTDSCPFSSLCEDFQKHVSGGKAWCPLFREFSR